MILRLLVSCFCFISPLGVMQILFILYQLDIHHNAERVAERSFRWTFQFPARLEGRNSWRTRAEIFEAPLFRFRKYTSLVSFHLRRKCLDNSILADFQPRLAYHRVRLVNTTNVNVSNHARVALIRVSNMTFYFLRWKLLTSFRAHSPVSRGLVNFRGLNLNASPLTV